VTAATVSKLKASLSEYLRRVKAGEEVLVSERGRPVAKLVPVKGADALPDHLAEMARQGLARVGGRRLTRAFWSLPRPRDPKGKVRRALLEERAEGRPS
jgi:prevent-host-death family protein